MKNTLLICLLFFYFGTIFSQENEVKVGLVLSGGGAKGLAHIGALKVIEASGVKIDYIGGTSMGAIIGALYAAGYSATELDSIFQNTDFANLIQDNLPRSAKTFYEKEDSERYALTLPFNNFRISFPQALSGGQKIYNELVRLLYHVKEIKDFDKLPIPFLCVATNVETGEEVFLKHGYLPEAILASGTFPSLFEPSEIDGAILIDGGVVNNYPIKEVKEMGANVLIGVDVQHGLANRESLMSATEVLLQINNYRTVRDMVKKSKETDIYIQPNIEKYSVIAFDMGKKIVRSGEVAANDKYAELKELALRQNNPQTTKKRIEVKDSLFINGLVLKGNNAYTRGYIKGKLRLKLESKMSFEKLQQGINNLAATGNFQSIRYELVPVGNEAVDLVVNLRENPNKTFLRLGLHYNDLYKSAAMINLTKKNILLDDDVFSFDFILGDKLRYNFQYYVDKGLYWSFGINSRFSDFDHEIGTSVIASNFNTTDISNVNTINLDVTDFTNQAYLQTVWAEEFAISLGVEHKFLKYSTKTVGETLIDESSSNRIIFDKSNYLSTYGQLTLDTYDDKYFPTRGLYFDGDFHLYLYSSDFNNNFREFSIAKARMGGAFPITKKISLNLETEGGFKLGKSEVTSFDFVLGGYGTNLINNFIPFLGYDFLSLVGNSFVKAHGRIDYEFFPKNHVLLAADFSRVDDDIFRTGQWFKKPDYSGYGLGYGWESFIGPVQVMYSWSPEIRKGHLFFSLGYWF
ncbi:patatin-like phospholipase family protein [Flavobacteriaceae bacterium KMM 6897]|nr:patatin-like phospholipase family protein [Flavobacteriaceae bacterium KMM 6897]MEB8346050.1 patatin-like phospholipase family protein [Flavobacteriaceae bacterium KMM 6898]